IALVAFSCEDTANSSSCRREYPHFAAIISAESPCGTRFGQFSIGPGDAGPPPPTASEPIGTRVMCSTPPATTSWAAPLITAWAAEFTACSPEPQNRLTVVPGTSTRRGAAGAAPRAILLPCAPAG